MGIPFTIEQFYGVFRAYNIGVWPAQWFLVLLWCLVGTQAAFLFGVWPDLGLIAAGAVGTGLLLSAGRRRRTTTA
jgi:hypothetical protein